MCINFFNFLNFDLATFIDYFDYLGVSLNIIQNIRGGSDVNAEFTQKMFVETTYLNSCYAQGRI